MSHDETQGTDRRTFLQAGALAAASAAVITPGLQAQDPAKPAAEPAKVLPTRKLGKTGVEMTMLEMGSGALRDQSVLDKMLRLSFAAGVRTFDTAKVYGTEPGFKRWFTASPEVRKQIVLVTKDEIKTASQLLTKVDERLAAIGTDYLDFYFVHGLGDRGGPANAPEFAKSQEFKEVAEKLKKSGKVKFIGFSTHSPDRADIIKGAAEGGFVDAIMVMYNTPMPWLMKDEPLNKALDAAHKAGIGLISMKQVAGQFPGGGAKSNYLDDIAKIPAVKERGLTAYQGLLHAIWTDERISGSCVSVKTTDQLRDNSAAARSFAPLKEAELRQIRDAALAANPTMCAECDGRCSLAAGTKAELGNLTRFLTYHEHHGIRAEARRQYAALPAEAKDWSGADLEAARQACPSKLDFAALLPEAEKHLA